MMNWPKLLNWDRLCETRKWALEPDRSPWQIDYDRIVFSSCFRRLQDKTQVFPLSGSDYIRTRLTHSVEVSTVARTLGTTAGATIIKRHKNESVDNNGKVAKFGKLFTAGDIGALVAAAALAHDIGNPPFGHSGEDAVRHWFDTTPRLRKVRKKLGPAQLADFSNWEGNAQGFRILTRLQMYKANGGMRLTHSTLSAFLKYPTQSTEALAQAGHCPASRKKFGFFQSEGGLINKVASATGLLKRRGVENTWCRHPLAFLMEAADDICYRIVDLEDGFRLNRVSYADAFNLLRAIATDVKQSDLDLRNDDLARIGYLRAIAIRQLVLQVVEVFLDNEEGLLNGKFDMPLSEEIRCHKELNEIKKTMRQNVYNTRSVLETEAAGFQIIPGLLDLFWSAVTADEMSSIRRRSEKVLQLIPEEFHGPVGPEAEKAYERLLRISDYVTGMTDSYALSIYRKLNGIALPS